MRPVWREGMIIGPQHLQAWDRHLERLLADSLCALHDRPHGVARCRIDRASLTEGVVRVDELDAILPDGTLVRVLPGDSPPRAEVPTGLRGPRVRVYLALAESDERHCNLHSAEEPSDTPRRYRLAEAELHDTLSDGGAVRTECLEHNLVVLFEGVERIGMSALKLAELERGAGGAWQLAQDYVPPSLTVGASPGLIQLLERIQGRLTSARASLNVRRAEFVHESVGINGLKLMMMLSALNACIARLDHNLTARRARPDDIFSLLLELVGALGTFDASADPLALPRFRRDDLVACFSELEAALGALLEPTLPSRFTRVPLEAKDKNRWECTLHSGALDGDPELLILVDGDELRGLPPEQLLGAVKLAAPESLDYLVRRRRLGVSMSAAPVAPPGVQVPSGAQLFRVRPVGEEWREVRRAGALSMYVPDGLSLSVVELLLVPGGVA